MFLGHYGVALAAKRAGPRVGLGMLILAAQWADLLWPILLLAGVERVAFTPGITVMNPIDFVVYIPDLPIFPGGPKVGLGLWNSPLATHALEVLILATGLVIYLRTTAARDRVGT